MVKKEYKTTKEDKAKKALERALQKKKAKDEIVDTLPRVERVVPDPISTEWKFSQNFDHFKEFFVTGIGDFIVVYFTCCLHSSLAKSILCHLNYQSNLSNQIQTT